MKTIACLFLLLTIGFAQKDEIIAVGLVGGGGGQKLIQMDRFRNESGDLKLEISAYGISRNTIMLFQKGLYSGAEFNSYQLRPYAGITYLIIGFNTPKRIPIIYIGATSGIVAELNEKKPWYMDGGFEASIWAATLLGTLQLTERVMAQEWYQTRLDYLFKVPFFGEKPGQFKK